MNVRDIKTLLTPDGEDAGLVKELVTMFDRFSTARGVWDEEVDEITSFVFATDTKQTTNSKLPFHNTTTIPKLAHIRNNLVIAYTSQLIPNSQWIQFTSQDEANDTADVKSAVEGYVRSKSTASELELTVNRLVQDWVDTGVCVTQTRYVTRKLENGLGALDTSYSGPEAIRVDPRSVFWDATASNIRDSNKVIQQIKSLGDLKQEVADNTGLLTEEQFQRIKATYNQLNSNGGTSQSVNRMKSNFQQAGFGDMEQYYSSNQVELLTFYGTFYDTETDTLYQNYRITVANRRDILSKSPASEWASSGGLHISIYETRRNCLIPISPLARVVGLQYKIDKLENLRADVFDRIANPPIVEIGDVTFSGVRGAPGSRYRVMEGGDVKELTSASPVLSADMQIANVMSMMDDLTGNPREALGTRTPGEKTKFEVQILDQGQNRSFRYNLRKFEIEMLNPILNDYLGLGRLYIDSSDIIEVFGNDTMRISEFVNITKEKLGSGGRVHALGASIFSEKANILQTLVTLLNGPVGQVLMPHTSRIKLYRAIERLGDLEGFNLFMENIGVQEDGKTRALATKASDTATESTLTDTRLSEEGQ